MLQPAYNGAFDFPDATYSEDEYTCAANVNMTSDSNKGINSIDYNYLNLPVCITFSDGHVTEYVYDAAGNKRSVIYKVQPEILFAPVENSVEGLATAEPLIVSSRKDYSDSHIYNTDGNLMTVITENGYIEGGSYHFYVTDYQGNNRVVFDQSGNVEQVNHYYPYGGVFTEGNRISQQPYKFGGKELDRMNGLDMYDFGARQLDSAVPSWTSMDPMAEKYYSISPFAYCAGNPVRYVDPNGEEIWVGNVQYQAGMKYYGKDVFTKSVISALNLIYKSGGDKAIGDLIGSHNKYNYKEIKSEGGSYTQQQKDGSVDINLNTSSGDRNQFLSATAHETMHGLQFENGQGGNSIFNEVEAYAFEMNISINSLNDLSVGFQSGSITFNEDNLSSRVYNKALSNLSYDGYSAFDMTTAVKAFKKGAAANNKGLYNNYPLRTGKEKKSMIQKYMRVIK